MLRKITTMALIGASLAIAACNTVRGAAYLDVVGQREAPFERAVGNAAVDVIESRGFAALAANDQHALLRGDFEVVRLEPCHGNFDLEVIVVDPDQVERRVILATAAAAWSSFKHVE